MHVSIFFTSVGLKFEFRYILLWLVYRRPIFKCGIEQFSYTNHSIIEFFTTNGKVLFLNINRTTSKIILCSCTNNYFTILNIQWFVRPHWKLVLPLVKITCCSLHEQIKNIVVQLKCIPGEYWVTINGFF